MWLACMPIKTQGTKLATEQPETASCLSVPHLPFLTFPAAVSRAPPAPPPAARPADSPRARASRPRVVTHACRSLGPPGDSGQGARAAPRARDRARLPAAGPTEGAGGRSAVHAACVRAAVGGGRPPPLLIVSLEPGGFALAPLESAPAGVARWLQPCPGPEPARSVAGGV
jgi:hypothetical protein